MVYLDAERSVWYFQLRHSVWFSVWQAVAVLTFQRLEGYIQGALPMPAGWPTHTRRHQEPEHTYIENAAQE